MSIATITLPSSNFTDRDFDSWVPELRTRANTAFPTWTDFNTPNFGNILLEMFAHTLDVISFTQDQQFLETRIAFARLRKSMIALGKNFGFTLPGAAVASADLEITFADGLPRVADLTIPKGTVVTTQDGTVEFDTLEDALIPAGQIQVTLVPSENATIQNENFVAPNTIGFSFPLGSVPFVQGSSVVVIGVDTWDLVDDFFSSIPTDKVYVEAIDDQDRGTLVFGDGTNGAVPTGNGTCEYKTGGGSNGNVDPNKLTRFRDSDRFPTTSGETVQLTVRNPIRSGGGVEKMSVEEARVAIPASIRTSGKRSVTHQDYEDNSRKVRGVARAMILTADDVSMIPENTGQLYIIPVGGGLPTTALKNQVLAFILANYPPTITFTLGMFDPILHIISVTARVFLNRNITHAVARTAVELALDSYFSLLNPDGSPNTQIDFGFKVRTEVMQAGSPQGVLPWSDIFSVISDTVTPQGRKVFREVDKASVVPGSDVDLTDTEFPVLGSVSLIDGDTNVSF